MKMKKWLAISLAAAMAALSLTACGGGKEKTTVKVGSKDFTESLVVAEIYALALEDAGYAVERSMMKWQKSFLRRFVNSKNQCNCEGTEQLQISQMAEE